GGDVWFVAKDVADVLEYGDTHNMVRFLDEDDKDTHQVSTLGGCQMMKVINESGLYSAILIRKKPQAKAFKKWVTCDGLPAI
ncbi:BRO-N domain-containing protein, partial [Bacillus cereus]|uniref:BRO-N domain-containing protein n=1 Tax=Bacillus cereus TaxID=1396 RepID=UPI0018F286BF